MQRDPLSTAAPYAVPAALDIGRLAHAYRDGTATPTAIAREVLRRCALYADNPIWITRVPDEALLARAAALEHDAPARALPLYGIPFAVKDNIDVAGLPTTAACEAFRHVPVATATAVQRLLDAGAMLVGKTNLDQFATGLVGTRSPYGEVRNAFDPAYVSGGSSSGSAVAVALGLASFALGTDTAGSGRVPAAFNNLVGLKPTRGLVSARGVVPACRTLDCVSVFALDARDARAVLGVLDAYDADDPYARHDRRLPRGRASAFRAPARSNSSATTRRERPSTPPSPGSTRSTRSAWRWTSRPSSRPPNCSTAGPGWRSAMPRSARCSTPAPMPCCRSSAPSWAPPVA
jgi:allophanate hydrolase